MKASLYFFILYDRPEKVSDSDISFVVPEKKSEMPECLYTYEKYDDKKYKYNKIYKVDKSLGKGEKKNEYYFEFIIKEEKYRISFDSKGNTFVYDIRLVFGKKILEIVRNISQNKEYIKKTEIFIEALKENKEETLIDTLYKETLHLYKKKKGFSFLIGLFVKIYKKKDLCSKLLKTFKEMNDNKKDNEKNQDRKPFLKDYIPDLEKIKSEADKYNTIDFYGIILSYFNYYDYNKFGSILKELYDKKPKDLFEIMIIYNTHLKNLIRENSDFFNKFISYTIENKDFDCFGKALNYINDIETFLIAITYCIENNKEDILSKCKDNDKIIKLDNLKFKEKEKNKGKNIIISSDESSNNYIKRTLEMIEEIINFSSENDMVLVHFTNSFWYYILNCFNEPNQENIENCNKIRMTFIKYYDLVTKVIKKNENKIKKDVINYYEKDEFAILLDEIIRKYLNHEKSLTNIEKLGFISKHNPFYNKENINFSNKRELDILDLFNLNDINNDFVHDFKGMGFESIFKDKLPEYIKKIMDKIKTVKNFIPTIELINIDNLDNKNLFLDILNKKYENIIVNNIKNLKSQDLKEAIDVIVQITLKNYFYKDGQKKFDFIENQIKNLDKSIIADIFIEILNVLYNKNDNEDENIDKEDENRDKEDNSEEEKNNIEEENSNKDEDYNEEENDKFYQLRNYIIDEFSKNINNSSDINNIIKLINIFKGNNKINDNENNQNINPTEKEIKNIKIINEILNKLIKAHSFNRDDFFSNNQNINIELLYALYKNEIITKDEHNNQDYYEEIQNVLKEIKNDIAGDIKKSKLEEFLKMDKSIIIERLSLMNLYEKFDPDINYDALKKQNDKIKKDINTLIFIKANLIEYYKETYQDKITSMKEVIENNKNKRIKEYRDGKIENLIEEIGENGEKLENGIDLKDLANKINDVKNFLLFKVIYKNNPGKNENEHFYNAYNKLNSIKSLLNKENGNINDIINTLDKDYKQIINEIREKLSKIEEDKVRDFITTLEKYCDIKDTKLMKELTILFKAKKYEIDIKAIIFFFEYFQKYNQKWNELFPKKDYQKENENDFNHIKKDLQLLQKNDIYDYELIKPYNTIFKCLYEKNEAIDFLFKKTKDDIKELKKKIQPTDRTIDINDIISTEKCIYDITEMKKLKDNFKIFNYITNMNQERIDNFKTYSKIYNSIIELDDSAEDLEDNIHAQVLKLIKNSTLSILQDTEIFLYYDDVKKKYIGDEENEDKKDINDLINLKNQIHIKNNEEYSEDSELNSKFKDLIFFKRIISEIELINRDMKILRKKGSSLPIQITITISKNKNEDPSIKYKIDKLQTNFEFIKKFLFDAKNTYISQLNSNYKEKLNLRFVYGKQFRTIMKHLGSDYKIDSFLRYILNNTDNNESVNEGEKITLYNANDYIKYYEIYNQNSLDMISKYITSLFNKNNKESVKEHYYQIGIKTKEIYKGIDIYECGKLTMEESILILFLEKTNNLPIAQNVLIANKETSSEEIQAFFHRAILCIYNTLFVVGINDSFTEYQKSIMNSYIDNLLTYKYNLYKNDKNMKDINRLSSKDYLESYIVFVYDEKNRNIIPFINEINKFTPKDEEKKNIEEGFDKKSGNFELKRSGTIRRSSIKINKDIDYSSKFENILVITSEICGLGKSEKIRQMITIEQKKKYFTFQLGGILTKTTIYEKLKNLIDEINRVKTAENLEYKNIAIHLNLTESKETTIINEFFFSFLITKFYTNNENIIYVPKDIYIYIEIPNCFENYFSHFGILKIFKKDNITFENMPKFNYSKDYINIFERMLGHKLNEDIQKFVEQYIGVEKYSYHQINIFMKLFISQYNKFSTRLTFLDNGEDVTEKCIQEFAYCTKYFTNGGFPRLLTGLFEKEEKQDYLDKLSKIFDNDLINTKKDDYINKLSKIFDKDLRNLKKEVFINQLSKIFDKDIKNMKKDEYMNELSEVYDSIMKKEDYIDKLSRIYDNDLHNIQFETPLIFIIKKEKQSFYDELMIPTKDSEESKKYQKSSDYLRRIKQVLDLPYSKKDLLSIIEEKNNNYVITNDNFKKMVLLVYRIIADVPVIIMGDTGCGKTALITVLNQIIHNGGNTLYLDKMKMMGPDGKLNKNKYNIDDEKNKTIPSLIIINIHPGITDKILCDYMEKVNKIAEKDNKEIWLFFDEMNTCLSLSLLTEIFINRTYNEKPLCKNIRIIGACNPYRRRKGNKEKCGLSLSNDNEEELVYLVQPLPQSLLYYVFSFGSIDSEDEKKYIHSIIQKSFTKEENTLHNITRDAISACHIYLREKFDASVVSLREIARFSKCIEFFNNYFDIKNKFENKNRKIKLENNKKNNKLRSIICSIYLCYYIRLTSKDLRSQFEQKLRPILLKLINNDENFKEEDVSFIKAIKNNKDLTNEIIKNGEKIEQFGDFIKIEQDYLIEQIDLDKGIGKNSLLKENVFLLFVSVITNIPLIIIGKPGTGKSLSAQLICKSMRGKYSKKNTFFHEFKKINQIYFQGSESTQPEDVQRLFRKGENKLENYKKRKIDEKDIPIIMILFDELGLAERSKSNPLKVLHSKLEYTGKEEGISFVGISNYTLDAAKVNRALVLSVPDLDQELEDLINTSQNIVESIESEATERKLKNEKIFEIISKTYFAYKQELKIIKELVVYQNYLKEKYIQKNEKDNNQKNEEEQKEKSASIHTEEEKTKTSNDKIINENNTFESIKTEKLFKNLYKKEKKIRIDFHGNRDFYYLIKGIAYKLVSIGETTDKDKVPIIIKYIERNFGGIEYEIDIDFKNIPEGMRKEVNLIKIILKKYNENYEKEITKLNSVYLFTQLYNKECEKIDPKSNLIVENKLIEEYDLSGSINDNINDNNSRYLLLEISPTLSTLIYQNIVLQSKLKPVELYDGSTFIKDNNKEYRFRKINQIQDDAQKDKLIVIENLNQIHPFLFDLYNMNYIIKDESKYVRICLENFNEQLTKINDKFRIIILVDKNFVKKCDLAFLNRLEKLILTFDNLLDSDSKNISKNLINEINLKKIIGKYENINYSLEDLLINCGDEDIQGLIYYFNNELKKGEEEQDNDEKKEKKAEVEEKIKNQVINKIYKILPQDIICILPDTNKIKEMYKRGQNIFYNFEDYINDNELKNNKYKISIIYTFTSIANIVRGLNQDMRIMISQINSENELKDIIYELKKKNENNKGKKEYNIIIDFEQSNSKIIKFVSNFIMNKIKDDEHKYNYILIIHINRHFKYNENKNKKNKERIYSLPDINPKINQIFIDDLNSNNEIKLKDLLIMDIKQVLKKYKKFLKLREEFDKSLINILTEELRDPKLEKKEINDYINKIQSYMNENKEIKNKIIEMAYNISEDDDVEQISNCKDIIENLYNTNYIKKYTIDIKSCLIKYIKDNIFIKNFEKIIKKLEDNNILTTIFNLQNNNFEVINRDDVENLLLTYLDTFKIVKNEQYKPKFLFKYNIPGLYKFYQDISYYISKDIASNYFYYEKKIRETKNLDDKIKDDFHEQEQMYLYKVIENLKISENKFLNELLNKVSANLIFAEYVTFYLEKYKKENKFNEKNNIYHKLIEILLKLRFNEENEIIQENNSLNILCLKIMWIESNVNYILNIFQIFESANQICNKLVDKVEDLIFNEDENKLKYITNENKKHSKEVNECFYILLASICYCITSEEINLTELTNNIEKNEIDIEYYLFNLKEINKTLQNLNNDLHLSLNEMYIIDEFIKVIEIFIKKNNIKKINELKNLIRDNAKIIQKYHNNEDKKTLIEELSKNFEKIYESIKKDASKNIDNFYDNLRYIFYKEIQKISDDSYRYTIFEKVIENDEILKKSNKILQILLKKYVPIDKYMENKKYILENNDDIIILIEGKLKDNFTLSETLLYFFENSSLNYLRNKKEIKGNNNEKKLVPLDLEEEPFTILKDCYQFLNDYINTPGKFDSQKKEICKLYCIGYIKTYIYKFAKALEDDKYKDKYPKNIRDFIKRDVKEKEENKILKIMRLYFYKILYNDFTINVFLDKKLINKFGLKEFNDYKNLIKTDELENINKIDYQIKTLQEGYQNVYKMIEKYKVDHFEKMVKKTDDLNIIEEYGLDNFYIVSYNIILINLQLVNCNNNSDIMKNFYNNVCMPIFGKNKDKLLSNAIQLFYDINKYKSIKQSYNIDSNKINSLFYGYRFCLNALSSKNTSGIYYLLYTNDKINEYFYPGNNIKKNKIYSSIIEHFKKRPNEGCYVCLCKEGGYYFSIPSGFPGQRELGKKCPKCNQPIGSKGKGWIYESIESIKRKDFYRILKDEKEEKKINQNDDNRKKLKSINHITLNEYKKKYIEKMDHKEEKGIYIPLDKSDFKSDSKIVRNLSQISFRLLNYILYSHLFFAKLISEGENDFDKYLPKEMSWIEAIYENWNILKNELLKIKINSIEKFTSYIFTSLFPKLNSQSHIETYEKLIEFEGELEKLIQKSIEDYKTELSKNEDIKKQNDEDKNSFISLLKETYSSYYYRDTLPFYEYFYYTDYLNKKYIIEKMSHMEDNKYPLLKYYLDSYNKDKSDKNKYSLEDLNLFKTVLNLFNENYSNRISKKDAKNKILKDEKIYKNNEDKINKFIKFYNNIRKKGTRELGIENPITDFLLIDNEFGEAYKNIYNNFINEQNMKLEKLLDEKIDKGIFDINCKNKINIQQIDENEIFTLNLPKKISFLDILYNSSYRKILDSISRDYEVYKEFVINYDLIEKYMTELLLSNKKLLTSNITEFIDNTELFSNQVTDIMSTFYKKYNVESISLEDKADIFIYCEENQNDDSLYKNIIKDFSTLIKYLNDIKNENNTMEITEKTYIYKLIDILKDKFSINFQKLFSNKDNFTVGKTLGIFGYLFKKIFENIKNDMDLDTNGLSKESKEKIDNYNEKEKCHPIKKRDFAAAIRLFATFVLYLEDDKENKIKLNNNNIVNYLKPEDLWDKDVFSDEYFKKNLIELKSFNLKINSIISLYDYLVEDIKDDSDEAVKKFIEERNKIAEDKNTKVDDPGDKINEDSDDNRSSNGSDDDENVNDDDD